MSRSTRAAPPVRTDAQDRASEELERWRRTAVPDVTAPLDADDLVRLVRDCMAALGLDPAIAADVSTNTVHYYRRKDIIDPPVGKTAAARYSLLHLWQIAGARLAGYLSLVTLADARNVIRGADEATSLAFLSARVADARAREAVRGSPAPMAATGPVRPLRRVAEAGLPATNEDARLVALPGNAWCVVPATHAAHRSPQAAEALARALAVALRGSKSS